MAEFLVSGYYGDNNAGDEAILAGMIRAIRAIHPEASFTAISKKAARTRAEHGVAAVSRNDFKRTWRAVGKADLLISGGGSLLQDVTSTKSLMYYLGIITMGKLQRTPVMLYAQGIGPVIRTASRILMPTVLNGVNQVTVRDPDSAEALRRLGVRRPPVAVTADPALVLGPSDPDWGAALLGEAGVDLARPVLGVSVRLWRQEGAPWQPALAKALDALAQETGGQVVFIPLQQPNDLKAAQEIQNLMQQPAILAQGDYTQAHVRAMISRCDLVLGMRFHALVFAAMNGIPLVGLSYDPKNDAFLRSVGESAAATMGRMDPGAIVAAARRALVEASAFRQRLLHKVSELTPLAHRNAQLAVELLERRGIL